jgi:hypothetical protein
VATIDVEPQLVTLAATPLNATVLLPWTASKFKPLIVTDVPIGPAYGDMALMVGQTVKLEPLLLTPLANTVTFPLVAPLGTDATMDVELQLLMVPCVPLKLTELWVVPKLLPEIVTAAPTAPVAGDMPDIAGAGTTVNKTPLLDLPLTVTITLPVVAPLGTSAMMVPDVQLEILGAVVPLNLTVLLPWELPKPLPLMVTDAPTAPVLGDKFAIEGPAAYSVKGASTVKNTTKRNIEILARRLIFLKSPLAVKMIYSLVIWLTFKSGWSPGRSGARLAFATIALPENLSEATQKRPRRSQACIRQLVRVDNNNTRLVSIGSPRKIWR